LFGHYGDGQYNQGKRAAGDERCADPRDGDESKPMLCTNFSENWQGAVTTGQISHVDDDVRVFVQRRNGFDDLSQRQLFVTQIRLDPNGNVAPHWCTPSVCEFRGQPIGCALGQSRRQPGVGDE
jgi:hypothetical protein